MIFAASSIDVSGSIVSGSAVIHWRTRASAARARCATARSRSRSVTIPTIRTMSSTTTTAPTFASCIFSAASPIVSDGSTVRTSFVIRSATVAIASSLSLPQQARKAAILEHAAAGLARRAVVDRVLLEVDLRDRRAADVTRLAEPLWTRYVARPSRPPRVARGRGELVVHRRREPLDLLVVSSVDSAYGESFAAWRISFAHARPMPAITCWLRSSGVQPARLARA